MLVAVTVQCANTAFKTSYTDILGFNPSRGMNFRVLSVL
jgi:hypothetical protein